MHRTPVQVQADMPPARRSQLSGPQGAQRSHPRARSAAGRRLHCTPPQRPQCRAAGSLAAGLGLLSSTLNPAQGRRLEPGGAARGRDPRGPRPQTLPRRRRLVARGRGAPLRDPSQPVQSEFWQQARGSGACRPRSVQTPTLQKSVMGRSKGMMCGCDSHQDHHMIVC